MKNKMVGIFICMLLIATAVFPLANANNINTNVKKEEKDLFAADLPDLKIEVKFYKMLLSGYIEFEIMTYNEGTSTIPAGTWLVWKLFSTPGQRIFWFRYQITEGNDLKPGNWHHSVISFPRTNVSGDVLTAVVDPPYEEGYPWPQFNPDQVYGIIKESNENNNTGSCAIPHVRSYNSLSPLFSLLSRFPMFERLLNLQ